MTTSGEPLVLLVAEYETESVLVLTPASGRLGKPVPHSERRCGGTGLQPELGENVQDVTLDRALAQREDVANRPVGAPLGHQPKYLQLTTAQTTGQVGIHPGVQ